MILYYIINDLWHSVWARSHYHYLYDITEETSLTPINLIGVLGLEFRVLGFGV
jgi:hypothetical protein